MIVGLVGNLLSLRVFATRKLRQLSASLYLSAISASDCLVLCTYVLLDWMNRGLPDWPGAYRLSLVNMSGICEAFLLISYTCRFVSVWLIVLFTAERYIAVCHPFRRRVFCTRMMARRAVAAVVLVATLVSLYKPLTAGVYSVIDVNDIRLAPKLTRTGMSHNSSGSTYPKTKSETGDIYPSLVIHPTVSDEELLKTKPNSFNWIDFGNQSSAKVLKKRDIVAEYQVTRNDIIKKFAFNATTEKGPNLNLGSLKVKSLKQNAAEIKTLTINSYRKLEKSLQENVGDSVLSVTKVAEAEYFPNGRLADKLFAGVRRNENDLELPLQDRNPESSHLNKYSHISSSSYSASNEKKTNIISSRHKVSINYNFTDETQNGNKYPMLKSGRNPKQSRNITADSDKRYNSNANGNIIQLSPGFDVGGELLSDQATDLIPGGQNKKPDLDRKHLKENHAHIKVKRNYSMTGNDVSISSSAHKITHSENVSSRFLEGNDQNVEKRIGISQTSALSIHEKLSSPIAKNVEITNSHSSSVPDKASVPANVDDKLLIENDKTIQQRNKRYLPANTGALESGNLGSRDTITYEKVCRSNPAYDNAHWYAAFEFIYAMLLTAIPLLPICILNLVILHSLLGRSAKLLKAAESPDSNQISATAAALRTSSSGKDSSGMTGGTTYNVTTEAIASKNTALVARTDGELYKDYLTVTNKPSHNTSPSIGKYLEANNYTPSPTSNSPAHVGRASVSSCDAEKTNFNISTAAAECSSDTTAAKTAAHREVSKETSAGSSSGASSKQLMRKEFTLTLLAVSGTFVVLNVPYCVIWIIQLLLTRTGELDHETAQLYHDRLFLARSIFFANYAVNFFLYCLTGGYFRAALRVILVGKAGSGGPCRRCCGLVRGRKRTHKFGGSSRWTRESSVEETGYQRIKLRLQGGQANERGGMKEVKAVRERPPSTVEIASVELVTRV